MRRRGGGVALYINKWIECEELSLKNSHEQVESLWIRIRDRDNKANLMVAVYYRLPDQGKPIHEAFLLQPQEALCSQTLVQRDHQAQWCVQHARGMGCHPEGRGQAREVGLCEPPKAQQGHMHGPAHGLGQPPVLIKAGG